MGNSESGRMPHKISVDELVGCFFVEWTGTVTTQELGSFFRDIASLPSFRSGLNGLHDMRQAHIRASESEMLSIGRTQTMVDTMFGAGRDAGVTRDKETHALLSSLVFIASTEERPARAFISYEDAKEWLGLPTDYKSPFDPFEE